LQAGIKRLVFIDKYSDEEGLQFLQNADVELLQIENSFL
jgi:dCMP deaminase